MIPITIYYLMSLTIYFFVGFITKILLDSGIETIIQVGKISNMTRNIDYDVIQAVTQTKT